MPRYTPHNHFWVMLHRLQYENDPKYYINAVITDKMVGNTHKNYDTDTGKRVAFIIIVRLLHHTDIRNITYQGHSVQYFTETADEITTSL